jgi:hypothetical protein
MKTSPQIFLSAITVGLAVSVACKIGRCDTIYALDPYPLSGTIEKFTSDGVGSVFATGQYGGALAVDSAGNVYAGSGSTIVKFNPNGASSVFANTSPYGVEGLAFDGAGNLYASLYNFPTYALKKFTPSGVATTFANISSSPGTLAVDQGGNLYLAFVGGPIEKFTPGGTRSDFASLYTFGLACDSAGNVYSDGPDGTGGDAIVRITPAGAVSVFADLGNDEPRGLAFDSAGNLYVARYGDSMEKFTPDGVASQGDCAMLGNLA